MPCGLALIPLIMHWPLILSPVHIVFLELIIDPACSIAFEAEPAEPNIMQRRPRDPKAPLFGMGRIFFSLFEGFIVLLAVLLVFGVSLYRGYGEDEVRALTFASLVVGMLGLIFVNRSRSQNLWRALRLPNRAFWWVVGGALSFLAAVLYIPHLGTVFRFAALDWPDLMIAIGAASLAVLCLEIAKFGSLSDSRGAPGPCRHTAKHAALFRQRSAVLQHRLLLILCKFLVRRHLAGAFSDDLQQCFVRFLYCCFANDVEPFFAQGFGQRRIALSVSAVATGAVFLVRCLTGIRVGSKPLRDRPC